MLSKDEYKFIKHKCKILRKHINELKPVAEYIEGRAPRVTEFVFAINLDLNDLEYALEENTKS